MTGTDGPVVTLDGPAGSGKSTTAREVARRLQFRHLDSGACYRALTYGLLEAGVEPDRWASLTKTDLSSVSVRVEPTAEGFRIILGDRALARELRSERVTEHVSRLAELAPVRERLLEIQREAGRRGRLVAEGRDMGTVVFPDAEVKVFLTADIRERARRRLLDQGVERPSESELAREAALISERDRHDSARLLSPLRRPRGAFVLDTTRLTFEEQVGAIVKRVHGVDAHPTRV